MEIVRKKVIIDGYLWSQIPLLTGLAMSCYRDYQKNAIAVVVAGAVGVFVTAFFKKAAVHNLSNLNVICKDENSEEIAVCPPGHNGIGIDGFKVKGKVYKLIDGNDAYIMPNGSVIYSFGLGYILNAIRGTKPPVEEREGWDKLFNAKEEDFIK